MKSQVGVQEQMLEAALVLLGPDWAQHAYMRVRGAGCHLKGDSDSKLGNNHMMPMVMTPAALCVSRFALDSDSHGSSGMEGDYLICTPGCVCVCVLEWWWVSFSWAPAVIDSSQIKQNVCVAWLPFHVSVQQDRFQFFLPGTTSWLNFWCVTSASLCVCVSVFVLVSNIHQSREELKWK